jgi:cytochrome c oxidase accessory protein FixG
MIVTLGIYYVTPWIRWDRGPNLPDQAVLIDLANRRFFFFWIEIWPHEFYFVAGLLIMAGLGLFLFTSALGRVWCGYTCPQTVWTDLFFPWSAGSRATATRGCGCGAQKWDFKKVRLRLTKYLAWLLIAVATGGRLGVLLRRCADASGRLFTLQAHPVAYATVGILTATTFVLRRFHARTDLHLHACPWPRIQAAMMDEDTITVAYREWRGEPRGNSGKEDARTWATASTATPASMSARGHRHPRRPAAGMHHLRAVHRRLRRHHGQDRQAARPDRLHRADRRDARARGQGTASIWKHVFRLRTIIYTSLWSAVGIGLSWRCSSARIST